MGRPHSTGSEHLESTFDDIAGTSNSLSTDEHLNTSTCFNLRWTEKNYSVFLLSRLVKEPVQSLYRIQKWSRRTSIIQTLNYHELSSRLGV